MAGDLKTSLIGAGAGAIAGLLVNLFSNRWRLFQLHRNLRLEPQRRSGTHGSVRIHNAYIYPLMSAYAYVTIYHDLSDVVEPPAPFDAYITKDHLCKLQEDRLCWSATMPTINPPFVDIYPGERQALDVINVNSQAGWIEIPSKQGWATYQDSNYVSNLKKNGQNDKIRKSRVFLKLREYSGTIKIVSKDTKAKEFKIVIDPKNEEKPIALGAKIVSR